VLATVAGCRGQPADADAPAADPVEATPTPAHHRHHHRTGPVAAVGRLDDLDGVDRALFVADGFAPLRRARAGDWLEEHAEYPQSVARFAAEQPNRPDDTRRTIYLLPLGRLYPDTSPPIEVVARYVELYFGLPARVLPLVPVSELGVRMRQNPYSKNTQMHAGDVLEWMKKRVPADAYAVMALTETDLYPQDSWNYVFGQASFHDRVAVQSTARYHPWFYGMEASPAEARALILRRTLKVVSHELGHAFGISHCTYFACVMNGSNHLEEADRAPMHLCPVDLRKLQTSTGFEPRPRYEALASFYREIGLDDQADWIDGELERGL